MKYFFLLFLFVFSINMIGLAAETEPQYSETAAGQERVSEGIPMPVDFSNEKQSFLKRGLLHIQAVFLPGNFPSFLWSFLISAIGAYTIYGLVLGPLSVLAVYFMAKKKKSEVMKAVWGWLTGTAVGLGIWILIRVL
jgi:hypothetical protein